jgi:hypothetical protein
LLSPQRCQSEDRSIGPMGLIWIWSLRSRLYSPWEKAGGSGGPLAFLGLTPGPWRRQRRSRLCFVALVSASQGGGNSIWREGGNFSVAREAAQSAIREFGGRALFLVKTRVAGTLRFWGYPPLPTRGIGGQLLSRSTGPHSFLGLPSSRAHSTPRYASTAGATYRSRYPRTRPSEQLGPSFIRGSGTGNGPLLAPGHRQPSALWRCRPLRLRRPGASRARRPRRESPALAAFTFRFTPGRSEEIAMSPSPLSPTR